MLSACSADFFQPTQRLSSEQTHELIAFLHRSRPEIERGRFGFAQWLSRHGPRFIQALPHGVLVELVQLLLNKKVLQFRKGRVSVTTASALSLSTSSPSFNTGLAAVLPSSPHSYGGSNLQSSSIGRMLSAVESGRVGSTTRPSLMAAPQVSTPSDRAFIPASILPFSSAFNAVEFLSSLCLLRRSTASFFYHEQYSSHLPLYHYEQTASPTSSSAVWVSVCTVVFRGEPSSAHNAAREFKSTQHESKSAAQHESARRALQEALWYVCFDHCLTELKHLERQREGGSRQERQLIRSEEQRRSEAEESYQQLTADSVRQLDRYLAFLSQAPIVYTLQSHVLQNSAGARTLWQARGQVMLEGQLLPADRVRVRTWNGCELVLSSTPLVAYAAEARKTQAKALVSQQLISKMAATTAALAAQSTSPPLATPSAPITYTASSRPAVNHSVPPPAASSYHSSTSWRSPHSTARPSSSRDRVPLTSSTLFSFPSYSEYGGGYERDADSKRVDDRAEGEEYFY